MHQLEVDQTKWRAAGARWKLQGCLRPGNVPYLAENHKLPYLAENHTKLSVEQKDLTY